MDGVCEFEQGMSRCDRCGRRNGEFCITVDPVIRTAGILINLINKSEIPALNTNTGTAVLNFGKTSLHA